MNDVPAYRGLLADSTQVTRRWGLVAFDGRL